MNDLQTSKLAEQPPLVIADVSRCPSINFFNVDCIEFMKSKPDKCYDLAIVDPPYGIGDKFKGGKTGKMNFNPNHAVEIF